MKNLFQGVRRVALAGFENVVFVVMLVVSGSLSCTHLVANAATFPPTVVRGMHVETNIGPGTIEHLRTSYGANAVRIALNPRTIDDNSNDVHRGQAFEIALDKAEILLREVSRQGMYAIIDLHNTSSTDLPVTSAFWNNAVNKQIWINNWKAIVQRFLPYKAHIWGYDILNEPTMDNSQAAANYLLWATDIVAAIRTFDADTPVIVEGTPWANASNFANGGSGIPVINDSKVIYSFHFYDPYNFTHQGISVFNNQPTTSSWSDQSSYPGTIGSTYYDKNKLQQLLQPVRNFQLAHNNVPIYVGEFSALRWAPGAKQYISDAISLFEQYGWSWTYLGYQSFHGWDPDFNSLMTSDANSAVALSETDTDRAIVLKEAFQPNTYSTNDDIQGKGINLAYNGNMELDSNNNGTSDYWSKGSYVTLTRVLNGIGGKGQQVTTSQADVQGLSSALLGVSDNHQYVLTASMKVNQGTSGTFYAREINRTFGYVGSKVVSSFTSTEGQHITKSLVFTPDPGTTSVIVRFDTNGPATFVVDNVQLYDLGEVSW